MQSIANTYRHWFKEICNSFITYGKYNKKATNAFIEGKKIVSAFLRVSCIINLQSGENRSFKV